MKRHVWMLLGGLISCLPALAHGQNADSPAADTSAGKVAASAGESSAAGKGGMVRVDPWRLRLSVGGGGAVWKQAFALVGLDGSQGMGYLGLEGQRMGLRVGLRLSGIGVGRLRTDISLAAPTSNHGGEGWREARLGSVEAMVGYQWEQVKLIPFMRAGVGLVAGTDKVRVEAEGQVETRDTTLTTLYGYTSSQAGGYQGTLASPQLGIEVGISPLQVGGGAVELALTGGAWPSGHSGYIGLNVGWASGVKARR